MGRRVLVLPFALAAALGVPLALSLGTGAERPPEAAGAAAAPGDVGTGASPAPVTLAAPAGTVVAPDAVAAPPAALPTGAGPVVGAGAAQARLQALAETARALGERLGRSAVTGPELAGAARGVVVLRGDVPAAAAGEVSAFVTPDVLGLAATDGTGGCWLLVERPGAGRAYGRGTVCTGVAAVLASSTSW